MANAIRSGRARTSPRTNRSGPGWLWLALLGCGAFLYLPVAVLVGMSFNDGGSAYTWDGFSFRWYGELAADRRLTSALVTSLVVATGATLVATVLGTLLAVGLARHSRSRLLEAGAMAPAILPDLLLAIGLLAFFYAAGIPKSAGTVMLSHAAFGTAFVVAVVRARLSGMDLSAEEASRDLGAGAVATFLRITVPAIAPAIVAGALLVFTLSLDEFVIAYVTAGPTTQTLPIAVYSMVRAGITPEINALATILVVVSITVVVFAARTIRTSEDS